MQKQDPLLPEHYYHIFNRGNSKENIFREPANYTYFMELYLKYIHPIADLFAYCLMPNHFHFALQLKGLQSLKSSKVSETSEVPEISNAYSQYFSNYFNAYSKAFNKRFDRTGSLFQARFRRKIVASDEYLLNLIHYIHKNPQEHKFVKDFRKYFYSSYDAVLSTKETHVARTQVLELFGDVREFVEFHEREYDFSMIRALVEDDEI